MQRRIDDEDAAQLQAAITKRRYGTPWGEGAQPAPVHDYLVTALRGPAPCDGCERAARCGVEQLACSSFSVYASGRPERHWKAAPRTDASHERFVTVFGRHAKRAAYSRSSGLRLSAVEHVVGRQLELAVVPLAGCVPLDVARRSVSRKPAREARVVDIALHRDRETRS